MDGLSPKRQKIAVIGTGISGLSAAWLLNQHYDLTVFEQGERIGGHTCTVTVEGETGSIPVDMGFIVYNEPAYPNLTALFSHLEITTQPTDMSLAISLDNGRLEYAGGYLSQLFAQKENLVRPRFWAMIGDLLRFYRLAPRELHNGDLNGITLGQYLKKNGYGTAFVEDHLLPMAAAIWSLPCKRILEFPASAFIRFHENHGLLQLRNRPIWRTVTGGSATYVRKLTQDFIARIRVNTKITEIVRHSDGVIVRDSVGDAHRFDQVILATHGDQSLRLLGDPSPEELRVLSAFTYNRNVAYLHSDLRLMPKRKKAWASWNYIGQSGDLKRSQDLTVSYWMNLLQGLPVSTPLFVTLNPQWEPRDDLIHKIEVFEHPVMDAGAIQAQRELWSLQGQNRTWFCGAYFGTGFHEDGLQSGLAVAEALSGVRRPWTVSEESARIHIGPRPTTIALQETYP